MATGISKRHTRKCRSALTGGEGKCNCDGSWQAFVSVKIDGKPTKIRKQFSGPGAHEAAKGWRADWLAKLAKGMAPPTTDRRTLAEALDQWLDDVDGDRAFPKRGRSYKPATRRSYRGSVENYVKPSRLAYMKVVDIRRADLQRFANELLGSGLEPASVASILNPLRAFYRRMVEDEVVTVNPSEQLRLPGRGRRPPIRVAPVHEAEALLAPLSQEDRPLWAGAFYAGLRRGELQALRRSDVDLGRSLISVARGWDQAEGPIAPKSVKGERTLPLIAILRDYLDQQKLRTGRDGDELVFGRTADSPFVPTTVNKRAKRCWQAAGLEAAGIKPIKMHECRHTFASLLIDAGVNAKALQVFMGHATVTETFDTYGHLMPGAEDQARAQVDAYVEAGLSKAAFEVES